MFLVSCTSLYSCGARPFSTDFDLTESDIRDYNKAAEAFESSVINNKNEIVIMIRSLRFVNGFSRIFTQYTVSYVNYCKDMKDEKAVANYEFAFKAYNDANNLYRETLKNILLSDSEYAQFLFEDWSEEEKRVLLDNNDNVYRLNEENEKLLIKYRDLDEDAEGWMNSVDEIYFELVKNNNDIAKEYGYSSYYDYSSKVEYMRPYTAEEREMFRGYVRDYIIPLYNENYQKFEELKNSADEQTKETLAILQGASYSENKEIQGYVSDFIATFTDTGDTGVKYSDGMSAMFKPGRAVFANGENSLDGAFTTYLMDYNEPIAYFGPRYQNMLTVTHEMGHYAAFARNGFSGVSVDLCEVHSQANEWLLIAYLEDKIDPEVYEMLMLSRLLSGFETIIVATAVDECEERIYSATDADSKEDYSEIISEVMSVYGDAMKRGVRLEEYYRLVAADNPVYYLSYAVSEIASVSYFIEAVEDYDEARASYVGFVDGSFDPESEQSGLSQPFDEEVYKSFAEMFGSGEDAGDDAEMGTVYSVLEVICLPAA